MGAIIALPIERRASFLVPVTPLCRTGDHPESGTIGRRVQRWGRYAQCGEALDQLIGGLYRPPSTEGATDTTSLVMRGTHTLWVMSLFASGCSMAGTGHDMAYSPRPLQSNNCGTPNQFKACGSGSRVACCQRTGVGAVQRSKSLVVIEELTGPAREAVTPGSYDLMDYSRSSVPDPAPLTPALGEPTPARDK